MAMYPNPSTENQPKQTEDGRSHEEDTWVIERLMETRYNHRGPSTRTYEGKEYSPILDTVEELPSTPVLIHPPTHVQWTTQRIGKRALYPASNETPHMGSARRSARVARSTETVRGDGTGFPVLMAFAGRVHNPAENDGVDWAERAMVIVVPIIWVLVVWACLYDLL
jgi:hypothetical protein